MANTSDSAAARALQAAAASGASGAGAYGHLVSPPQLGHPITLAIPKEGFLHSHSNLMNRRLTRSPLPSPKTGASLSPKGRALELGVDASYDISTRVAGEDQPQLEVLPITMYVTEYAEHQFSQIAVNGRYICYGLRAGQIRVLHKETAKRALLRGHMQQIVDMRFSPSEKSDVLASFGIDGNLFVKKIVTPSGDAGEIEEKSLLQVTVTTEHPAGVPVTPRVRWLTKSKIIASYGDGVFTVDVDVKAPSAKVISLDLSSGADAPDSVTVVSSMAGKPVVVDLAVAPGVGGRLAVAHVDGSCRVWSPAGDSFSQDSTFSPFDDAPDEPLASVFFASDDALVIGGENNKALAMLSLPAAGGDDMTSSPEHVQTVSFAPSGEVYNFAASAVPGARLVLLSNLKKQAVYAVHFAEDAKQGFDYISEFSTTMPVLSFTALREDGEPDEPVSGGGGTLQLYCMQTQAIQQYALAVDRCRPSTCVGDEAVAMERAEESESESDSESEDEVAEPVAAPATPTATTPKVAKQDSASKLLTPGELMSMAAGASDVKPTADKPKEEPVPRAKPAPKARAPPPPQAPPPHMRAPPGHGPPPHGPPPHGPPPHAPPPHGPLPGHLEALLGGLREQIYNDIAGFVAAQQAEVREERAAREAAERERQKQLLTAVSAAITRDLPVQIEKILKKELKNTAPAIAEALGKAKGGGSDDAAIAKALPAALTKAMTATVVPKFEAATTEMFNQVKSVFERGMDELATELYTQKENAVAAEVGPLVHSLRAASDEVRTAAELLMSGEGAPGGVSAAPSSLAELESQMDPTVVLEKLVGNGDMEGAFTKALGLSSVEMVAWVCGRAESQRAAIFGASPVGLSQGVLLSMAQQLSSDLSDEPNLKINWIRDAALAIDPSDAALAQHMRPILEAVFGGLHECATAPETPAPVKNDLRLCIHVVNSLLTACK